MLSSGSSFSGGQRRRRRHGPHTGNTMSITHARMSSAGHDSHASPGSAHLNFMTLKMFEKLSVQSPIPGRPSVRYHSG